MKKFLAFIAAVLISGAAFGQAVQQSGTVTPGHVPAWVTSGVIKDGGSATSSNITEMGVTKNGGLPFCVNSANTGALNRFCLTSTTNSGAKLTVTDQGGATDGTLTIDINGNSVVLPAAPGGTILPTITTSTPLANNAPVCLSGTDGTLKNCGGSPGTGTVTQIDTGTGLTGGPITTTGTISLANIANGTILGNSSGGSAAPTAQSVSGSFSLSSGTLSLTNIASGSILANATGGSAEPVGTTLTSTIDAALGSTRGSILRRGASAWEIVAPGTSGYVWTSNGAGSDPSYQALTSAGSVQVRQTVMAGPVNSSGYPNFGGSTGSTTVTASGTLVATSANGSGSSGNIDLICSITNPSWTGLSSNGTMYLYLDTSASTCVTGSGTLAPIYQWGGTRSTTSNQFTFNIQEMSGTLGNGSSAPATNRTYVGEVTVSGNVVTAITWYALLGRYDSGNQTITSGGTLTLAHNIGVVPRIRQGTLVNTTTDLGYSVGQEVPISLDAQDGAINFGVGIALSATSAAMRYGSNGAAFVITRFSDGVNVGIANASWLFKVYMARGW